MTSNPCGRWPARLMVGIGCLLMVGLGQPPRSAAAHDWYTELSSPQGEACCNDLDCEPVPMRHNSETSTLELELGGLWIPVDWSKVLDRPSPDGAAHTCWWRSWYARKLTPMIRCIILPSAS